MSNSTTSNISNVDTCFVCETEVTDIRKKSYLFTKSDRAMIRENFDKRKQNTNLSKMLCDSCVDLHYIKTDTNPNEMGPEDYLIIRNCDPVVCRIRKPESVSPKIVVKSVINIKTEDPVPCTKKKIKKSSVKSKNQLKVFQCHICLKQLKRQSRLRLHLQRHESKPTLAKVFCCSGCKMAFKDMIEAQMHICFEDCSDGSNNNGQNDTYNDETGGDLNQIGNTAVDVVEISQVYRCEFCDKVYCEKKSLQSHRKSHEGSKNPYECQICGSSFPTYFNYTTHKTTHRLLKSGNKFLEIPDVNIDSQYDKFPVVKLFLCEVCEMTFFDHTYLNVHKKTLHSDKPPTYNCKICHKWFSNRSALGRHIQKSHKENRSSNSKLDDRSNPQIISTEPSYHCVECGNTFLHSSGLRTHKSRIHKREQNKPCPHCFKTFYDAHYMKRHITMHSDERPFTCNICKKSFRNKNTFNEHIKTHSSSRPYSCDICGKSFKRSRAVKSHRLIHAKKRTFKCSQCFQCFKSHSLLRSHVDKDHNVVEEKTDIELCEVPIEEMFDPIAMCNDINWDAADNSQNSIPSFNLEQFDLPAAETVTAPVVPENQQDFVVIQDQENVDGQLVISYQNEALDQLSTGDLLIFNEGVDDMNWDGLQILDGSLCAMLDEQRE